AGQEGVWLGAEATERLLSAFGVTTAMARVVHDAEAAVRAAREIGGKVAVKSAAPVHKTELGGVHLGLEAPEDISEAVYAISRELVRAEHGELEEHGFLVQAMAGEGVEMMVGVTHDATFGPILVAGMGGTLVELLRDVSVRIHPLTDTDVRDMLTSLRGYPLLTGYRGAPPADIAALEDLLYRLSALVEEVPELAELDCNPVFVHREHNGVTVVDARVRLAPGHRRPRR
ncbi:MAG TPA: acetate--CoA ligase family protein, partial [Egibacteraceae bacterium]|nr:acetate--CoA ligase family protein [Egibacteraceae bacterium]